MTRNNATARKRSKPEDTAASPARGPASPRTRRRLVHTSAALLILLFLYTIVGFFAVPWLVKGPILARVNQQLNATATIDKVTCNPFTLRLIFRGVRLTDLQGIDVATVGEVDVNASLWRTIWRPGYQAQWALVRDVRAKAHVAQDGQVNIASLLKPAPAPKPGEQPKPLKRWPRLVVEQCRVERASIELVHAINADSTYQATLNDVLVVADGLDLGPTITSKVHITGKTVRDETFDVQVALAPDPLTVRIDAKAGDIALEPLSPYAIEYAGLNVRLAQGNADAELLLDLKARQDAPRALAEIKRVTARNVRVEYVDGPYAGMISSDIPRLDIEDVALDAIARRLSVERVALLGPGAFVRRNQSGQLDVETILRVTKEAGEEIVALAAGELIPLKPQPDPARPAAPPFEIPAKALPHEYPIERIARALATIAQSARGQWDVEATNVEVDGASLAWRDTGATSEVAVAASNVRLDAGPVQSSNRFEIPISASVAVAGGTARIEGRLRPMDLEIDATINAENIDAAVVAGYLPPKLGAGLDGASVDKALAGAEGTLRGRLVLPESAEPTIDGVWEGRTALSDVQMHKDQTRAVAVSVLATTGTLRANGPISTMTIAWEGSATAEAIALDAAIAGDNAGPVRIDVARGDLAGTATAILRPQGLGLTTHLDVQASGISAQAPSIRDLNATVASADVRDIVLDLDAGRARVEAILLQSPSVSTKVAVLPPRKDKAAAPAPPRDYIGIPEPAFTVEVGQIALNGASGRVEDPNATPPMVMSADRVTATLEGIATRSGAPIKVDFAGMVQESGRVSITGSVDLFRALPSGDVKIEVASMPLTGFDAATGRFLGYEVDRGRATVDMPLLLKDGELSGNVKINLDRFYLGTEVKSDEALNVPVQLGLSLLRDTNEQIDATVGVKGRIDEPGFTVAGLVWKAIANLIVKAATAPFDLLGALFGSEEDLSRVAFDPGTDRLGAASLARLDTMARAMRDRPGIALTVVAQPSPKADIAILKREGLRAWILEAVRKRDPRIVTLTDDLYRDQLNDAYMVQAAAIPLEDRQNVAFPKREEFLLDRIEIPQARLVELANARAQRVVDVLVKDGKVPAERVKAALATDETQDADEPETRLEMGK